MLGIYGLAIFAGAMLVFLVQPMVARLVLPLFGGSPAVWNTAMLFFQTLLLAGYLYAHLLTTRLGRRTQVAVHALVLLAALVALPIALPERWTPDTGAGSPIGSVLIVLTLAAGLPFFVVSSGGPLLQRWFSGTGHHRASDPYFLYAASNAGSLIGLLGYPLVIEPAATIERQSLIWSIGYAVFALAAIASGIVLLVGARRRADTASPIVAGIPDPGGQEELDESAAHPGEPVPPTLGSTPWRDRAIWIGLAFIPSSLMLGATQHITTDVAAVPLLWVIPLAMYLGSFIVVFSRLGPRATDLAGRVLPIAIVAIAVGFAIGARRPLGVIVLMHLALLAVVSLRAHGLLARRRPTPERLTEFYLSMSVGGALGGVFNALVAPIAFDRVLEYPIVIATAALLVPASTLTGRIGQRVERILGLRLTGIVAAVAMLGWMLLIDATVNSGAELLGVSIRLALLGGVSAVVAYVLSVRAMVFAPVTAAMLAYAVFGESYSTPPEHIERTFFGVHAVATSDTQRTLYHGTTLHGVQWLDEDRRRTPLSYYHPQGPAGDVFRELGPDATTIGLVGLGAGSIAAYTREGQRLDIFEIDPAIVRIARNPRWFTYLRDARAQLTVFIGDGRLNLERRPGSTYDLLVLDAFSSDAIPVHLLTREAVDLYMQRLTPSGVLLVHISNRHLDLGPVLAAIARDLGLIAFTRHDTDFKRSDFPGRFPSEWVAIARTSGALAGVRAREGWVPLVAEEGVRAWTDDYSSILSVLDLN